MNTYEKMREAVIEARRFVFAAMRGQRDILVNDKISEPYVIKAGDTLAKIDTALAAPMRNCDVGTAEEQKERFEEFCDDEKGDRQHCRNCRLCNALDCELAWAQMPYEEGGAR